MKHIMILIISMLFVSCTFLCIIWLFECRKLQTILISFAMHFFLKTFPLTQRLKPLRSFQLLTNTVVNLHLSSFYLALPHCHTTSQFLAYRGSSNGPLFIHSSKSPFSRAFIASRLQADLSALGYNPKDFNTHCFRIGRATDLAASGFSSNQIAILGRWRSNAFQKYIRPSFVKIQPPPFFLFFSFFLKHFVFGPFLPKITHLLSYLILSYL